MYALIRNGVVVNIIIADASFVSQISSDYDEVVACGSNVGVGFLYNAVNGFTTPSTSPSTFDVTSIADTPVVESTPTPKA